MSNSQGRFVWYELMTSDLAAAEAFYRSVVGWDINDSGMPGMNYSIASLAGQPNSGLAGMMTLPAEVAAAGGRPGWLGYIGVDDVDAYAARVQQAGGSVHHAPDDIPGVGRFAVVADPGGAAFALFKGNMDAPPVPPAAATPGRIGWHELHAADEGRAFDFYSALFGWAQAEAMDMGALGIYRIFSIGAVPSGGMMTKMADAPMPYWQFYINVDDIDAAAGRVGAGGGQVLHGPEQVPGGSWIVSGMDPQGAVFALVGSRR